jgi:hypothetical protein
MPLLRAATKIETGRRKRSTTSDYPNNIVGVGQLPLVVSPTIANVRLYHVLIDGREALNLISLMAF